jgi:hypothetical protein
MMASSRAQRGRVTESRRALAADADGGLAMRCALRPEGSKEEHRGEIARFRGSVASIPASAEGERGERS